MVLQVQVSVDETLDNYCREASCHIKEKEILNCKKYEFYDLKMVFWYTLRALWERRVCDLVTSYNATAQSFLKVLKSSVEVIQGPNSSNGSGYVVLLGP